jgi:hypothetical protein
MAMSPVGLGTKIHCGGEGQQEFSSQSMREEGVKEIKGPNNGITGAWLKRLFKRDDGVRNNFMVQIKAMRL